MKSSKNINIGKIIKSDSHVNYKCRVYGNLESNENVKDNDYHFGQFVKMKLNKDKTIIGIIYNSQLYNPDYGNFGPRLSNPSTDNMVFMPDFIEETAVILDILLLGWIENNQTRHGIPPWVIPLNTEVTTQTFNEFKDFHSNENDKPLLAYYNLILNNTGNIAHQLLTTIVNNIMLDADKDTKEKLELLNQHILWQQTVLATKV